MVKAIVGTGKVAEVDHQWVIWADVVVQPDAPAAVVERRDSLKVPSNPFKVATLLMNCRVRVPVEGKGNHFLAITTLPRVSRTGEGFTHLWDPEKIVKIVKIVNW